jgi:DNA-binding NarL/FixJ family response regulator
MTEKVSIPVTLKIVTVDDSPLIAERLKELIEELREVEFLGNTESIPAALEFIERKKPHVVFLDINLANDKPRNGMDLLNVLRKTYPVIKIIMLTNTSNEWHRQVCKSLGADYFFDKSEDLDKIPETLASIRQEAFGIGDGLWKENGDCGVDFF